jgi:hypothetical protein
MSLQIGDDDGSPARTDCSILAQEIPQDASFIIISSITALEQLLTELHFQLMWAENGR